MYGFGHALYLTGGGVRECMDGELGIIPLSGTIFERGGGDWRSPRKSFQIDQSLSFIVQLQKAWDM